jgi:tetratricopeptide (TPR) repeat protein
MLQMFFYVRFQTQLRRTRPELLSALENAVFQAIKNSGGDIVEEHHRISAVFTEISVGFWLDILIMLKTILGALETAAPDLHGYTIIIGQDLTDDDFSRLIRILPDNFPGTGIWCSSPVQEALKPYAAFGVSQGKEQSSPAEYAQLSKINAFSNGKGARNSPVREKIELSLKQGAARNVLLVGPEYAGIRNGLYHFCLYHFKPVPPLVIRFGSGRTGLCCLSDSLNTDLRSFLMRSASSQELEELDRLNAVLSRERFQREYSNHMAETGRRFLNILLDVYIKAAGSGKAVIILDNLHEADEFTGDLFIEQYRAFPHKKTIYIYGTWSSGTQADYQDIKQWQPVFPQLLSFTQDLIPTPQLPDIPQDLWEIVYAAGIFLRYFPAFLLIDLFEEAGKNPAMIRQAFNMLSHFGLIDFIDESQLRLDDLIEQAEKILRERREPIRLMVRNRLLAWVREDKFRPCFTLLKVLFELGWEGTDELILKALHSDIIYGTFREIEKAMENGVFDRITGQGRAPVLRHIYKTSKALVHGGEKEIRDAFLEPDPEAVSIPGYNTRLLTNRTNYLLSIRDIPAAINMVKKSIILIQDLREQSELAHAYRLFALISLANHRIADAVDYSFFAMENAEKSPGFGELGLICFYAAGIHFLAGNIFKAESFALRAEEAAISAGRFEWAERIRFFRGRLKFETGRYRDALKIFESMRNNLSGYKRSAVGQVLSGWIYRTNNYLRNFSVQKPEIPTGEGLFFQLEAAYLSGDYERAVKYSEMLLEVLEEQKFLFTEQPDWDSAYTQCEFFIIPRADFLIRIGSVFRALALCRLKPGNTENRKEAIRIIQRIVQDERLSTLDPNDAFYFYAYYLILKESGAGEVDMSTVISIAFKRLQRRANQIDNMEVKNAFLSLHYWNSALYLAAKEHKLI